DMFKVVHGVPSLVIWDVDLSDGEVAESELAFFAQDDDRNVWNTGEYPEEFEDGVFAGAPSTWITGKNGAEAGIHMPAPPQVGLPEYLQGFAPDIDFLDCAKIVQTGRNGVCVPVGCFDDVLVTDERSPLDPDSGLQRKFYAPGVGVVKIEPVGDPEGETLVLV